jgi:hypothetical protein
VKTFEQWRPARFTDCEPGTFAWMGGVRVRIEGRFLSSGKVRVQPLMRYLDGYAPSGPHKDVDPESLAV